MPPSTPLDRMTTGVSAPRCGFIDSAVSRTPIDGVTITTASAPRERLLDVGRREDAVGEDDVGQVDAGSGGSALMPSAISVSRDHSRTSWPLPPSSQLTAVPHEPAPMTEIRISHDLPLFRAALPRSLKDTLGSSPRTMRTMLARWRQMTSAAATNGEPDEQPVARVEATRHRSGYSMATTTEPSDTMRNSAMTSSQVRSRIGHAARRQHEQRACRGGDALAALEADVGRVRVPEDRGHRGDDHRPLVRDGAEVRGGHEQHREATATRPWRRRARTSRPPPSAPSTRSTLVAPRLPEPSLAQVDPVEPLAR